MSYFPKGVWRMLAISLDKTLELERQSRALLAKVKNKKNPTSLKKPLDKPH